MVCRRRLEDVAASIHRWYGTPYEEALRESEERWSQITAALRSYDRKLVLIFDHRRGESELASELKKAASIQ